MKKGFNKKIDVSALTKYLGKQNLEVGILSNAPDYPDGTPILEVATYNEFGGDSGNPPARHWLKRSVGADKQFYQEQIKALLKYPAGAQRDSLFRALGREAVERIAGHVESNDIGMMGNKPSVQARKGGDSPMIDTKHLVRSIDFRVNKGVL